MEEWNLEQEHWVIDLYWLTQVLPNIKDIINIKNKKKRKF